MSQTFQLFTMAQAAATETTAQQAVHGGAPADQDAPPQPTMGGLGMWFPMILIFAIMYFIMIRPAQRKEKERRQEINAMTAGTRVLFGGGLLGTITEVKNATFMVEIAQGVVVEVARGAVQRTITNEGQVALEEQR